MLVKSGLEQILALLVPVFDLQLELRFHVDLGIEVDYGLKEAAGVRLADVRCLWKLEQRFLRLKCQ